MPLHRILSPCRPELLRSFLAAAVLALIFLARPTEFQAQTVRINLDEAIETAIRNNHDLRSAALNVRKADAQVTEAFGNALPSLDLTASYTRNLQIPSFFVFPDNADPIEFRTGADNAVNARLNLRQTVFNGAVFNGVGTSRVYAQISRMQLRSQIGTTILDVRNAYYSALLAKEFLEVSQTSLTNAEANYREVNVLFGEGLVSEFDAIRSEVEAANLRPVVETSRNRYEDARNNLKVVLGLDPLTEIELTDDFVYDSTLAPAVAVSALQTDVGNRNFDLQTLQQQVEFNSQVIDIYRSEFLPTIDFIGNYTFDGQANDFDFLTSNASSVGLELRYNLFNGFRSSSRVEQAQVDELRAREQETLARKAVQSRVVNVMGRVRTAMLTISAQERTIAQAQRGYDIARARYTEGLGSQVEINDADEALRQAKLNKLQYIFDYMSALAELDLLRGAVDERYIELVTTDE